jgi:hypothetical protein
MPDTGAATLRPTRRRARGEARSRRSTRGACASVARSRLADEHHVRTSSRAAWMRLRWGWSLSRRASPRFRAGAGALGRSSALRSSLGGASRMGSEITPGRSSDGLAVTRTTSPPAGGASSHARTAASRHSRRRPSRDLVPSRSTVPRALEVQRVERDHSREPVRCLGRHRVLVDFESLCEQSA